MVSGSRARQSGLLDSFPALAELQSKHCCSVTQFPSPQHHLLPRPALFQILANKVVKKKKRFWLYWCCQHEKKEIVKVGDKVWFCSQIPPVAVWHWCGGELCFLLTWVNLMENNNSNYYYYLLLAEFGPFSSKPVWSSCAFGLDKIKQTNKQTTLTINKPLFPARIANLASIKE